MEDGKGPTSAAVQAFAHRALIATGGGGRARAPIAADRQRARTADGPASDPPAPPDEIVEELQVATEELLQQSEELEATRREVELAWARYQELFELAPDAYLVTTPTGTIDETNRAACELLGVAGRYLVGKPLTSFVDARQRSAFRSLVDELVARGRVGDARFLLRPRRGEPVHVSVSATGVPGPDGRCVALRWLLRDVSDRVRAEDRIRALNAELEQRVEERTGQLADALRREQAARAEAEASDQLKSNFLAVLSHEIRTPLQTLVGYTELLESGYRGHLNESQARDLRAMREDQEHILAIVNGILDLAKLQSGQFALAVERVLLTYALSAVARLLRPQLDAKGLTLELPYLDEDLAVLADGDRLRQILINLLANAVKFSPAGDRIELTCDIGVDRVLVHVRDWGVGIPADKAEAIFAPFVQLGRGSDGTGLGLAISRELAQAIGGKLTVASAPGRGSTFTLALLRATRQARDAPAVSAEEPPHA